MIKAYLKFLLIIVILFISLGIITPALLDKNMVIAAIATAIFSMNLSYFIIYNWILK